MPELPKYAAVRTLEREEANVGIAWLGLGNGEPHIHWTMDRYFLGELLELTTMRERFISERNFTNRV